jgi:hypothetical protein
VGVEPLGLGGPVVTVLKVALGSRWQARNGSKVVYKVVVRDDEERRADLVAPDGTTMSVDYEWFERRGIHVG